MDTIQLISRLVTNGLDILVVETGRNIKLIGFVLGMKQLFQWHYWQ